MKYSQMPIKGKINAIVKMSKYHFDRTVEEIWSLPQIIRQQELQL